MWPAPRRDIARALLWLSVSAALAAAWIPSAAAQQIGADGSERATVFFVPAFYGGLIVDTAFETRFEGVLGDDTRFAGDAFGASVGYLAYVDGHGRLAVGGSLGGALSLDAVQPGDSRFGRLDLRLDARYRVQNARFAHWSLEGFAELGGLWPIGPPADMHADPGLRWAVGIGVGPGTLFNTSPFLFGELVSFLAIESIEHPDARGWSLLAGLRIRIDYGIRGRDLPPCAYNPREFGPCP